MGTKAGSRLQLHPGLAPDSVTSFLINHLVALKGTPCGVCSKTNLEKLTAMKIILIMVSGHLFLLGTMPNTFHVFISHSTLSATQGRKG